MLEHLIVDSGAIIKGCGFDFHKTAKRFWTVQDVINEIRDKKSLHLLETLPFELEIRVPSDAAMRAVADFSRKTGDFAALSLTDLRVLALTYQLELEQNGTQFVRLEPARSLKMAAARAAAAKSKLAEPAKSSSSPPATSHETKTVTENMPTTTMTPPPGEEVGEAVDVEDSAALGGDVDDNEDEEFDEIIELEHLEGDSDDDGDDDDEDDDEEDEEEEEEDEDVEEGISQANPPIVTPKISWGASTSTPAGPGPDSTKAWASSGPDSNTGPSVVLTELQLTDEEQFPSLGMSKSTSKGRGGSSGSGSEIIEPDMSSSMVADININGEKTSMWADLGTWVEAEGGEGILPNDNKQPSSLSSSSAVSSSNNGGGPSPPKWSQVALASVSASEQIATTQGHTSTNASYNSTHSWGRAHNKPSMYKSRQNDASMPARKVEDTDNTSSTEQHSSSSSSSSSTGIPGSMGVATAGTTITPTPSPASVLASSASSSMPTSTPSTMPSRILSGYGQSGVGQQSAQAARRIAEEDDGAGWINPQNINKYRAGAHMMSPPSASAPSHSTTTTTTGNGMSAGRINPGATATAHSYSTMMMGGNAVTTAVTLDDFELVRSKKSSVSPTPATHRSSKNNRTSTPASSSRQPISSESFFQGTGSVVPTTDTNATADQGTGTTPPAAGGPAQPSIKTACVTTDFSMQNVMMQMGLSVISVDGLLIRAAKQWVLRCMACFKVHYELERLFCSKCGAAHMSRVGASVNARTGELRLHLKANYRVSKLGTKYSIPKPGSRGRYEGELLLREDQLLSGIWRQKSVKIKKEVASHFGADVTSDVGIHLNKGAAIVVGMGKRNPNAMKGRERRGKVKKGK